MKQRYILDDITNSSKKHRAKRVGERPWETSGNSCEGKNVNIHEESISLQLLRSTETSAIHNNFPGVSIKQTESKQGKTGTQIAESIAKKL